MHANHEKKTYLFKFSSILSELKCVLDVTRIHSRAAGRAGRGVDDISSKRRANGENKDQPEWLIRELLQHNRRHSVTLGDRSPTLRRQHDRINSIRKLCSLKVQIFNTSVSIYCHIEGCDPFSTFSTSSKLSFRCQALVTVAVFSLRVSLECHRTMPDSSPTVHSG